jgi:HEAT repeat protein
MKLQQIYAALVSNNEETRRSALDELHGLPLVESRDIIFMAMGDPSWRVRKEAVEVLVRSTPDRSSLEALLQLLRSEDNAGLRNSAAEAVIRLGTSAAEALIVMVTDADADVRKFIIDVMGAIGDRLFVPALVRALNDSEVNVASAAAEQLGVIGDDSAAPYLTQAIIERTGVLFRFSALGALGVLAQPVALPDEIKMLVNDDILRKAVFDCIGNISNESSFSILFDGLSSRQKSCRASALKALYKVYMRSAPETHSVMNSSLRSLEGSEVVPALLELYTSADTIRSAAVIWFCTMTLDERCVPTLFTALADESNAENALTALKKFGQERLAYSVSRYEKFDDKGRTALCALIGESGYSRYSNFVHAALSDTSAAVRRAAAEAVGKLGITSSLSVLVNLLDDPASDVRTAAVKSLRALAVHDRPALQKVAEQLYTSEAIHHRRFAAVLLAAVGDHERLVLLVRDCQAQVRKAAVSAIGSLRQDSSYVLQLVGALTDEDPDVRRAAAEVIGNIPTSPDVLPALEQALNDDDIWVQCAVMKAISRIDPERAVAVIRDIHQMVHEMLLISCLQILGVIGGTDARTIIVWALDSPEADVVRQARISLDQLSKNSLPSGSA